MATGLLGDQGEAERSASHARTILDTNLAGVVSVLTALAPVLVQDGGGFVVVIGSVAGERGRRSNYTYGAAKAGLATWTQGFRARYRSEGIHVMTVKPGFVDTRMIYGRPGLIGVANPMVVGERIVRALERGALVVYVPRLWRWVMLGVRMVPERVAQRLAW